MQTAIVLHSICYCDSKERKIRFYLIPAIPVLELQSLCYSACKIYKKAERLVLSESSTLCNPKIRGPRYKLLVSSES